MPHNQIPNIKMYVRFECKSLTMQNTLIKLIYQYTIATFAGNVRLNDFMEVRTINDFEI